MQQRNERITKIIIKSRTTAAFFVLILTLGLLSCAPQPPSIVLCSQDEWRTGDLMLRCGCGAESRVVTAQSKSAYSHIGILYYEPVQAEWMVIHAVPGEEEPEYIKMEPVAQYFHPVRAQEGAWMRVNCSDSIAYYAAQYAKSKYDQKIVFDNSYLLADSNQLYCTELVWRAYNTQSIDISGGNRHSVPDLFCKENECIFPNDIEKSETTLFVKPFKTKTL